MNHVANIVVLTGAGLSAESGLSTFRDKDGIWAKYDYREVATPEGFRANPALVHDFYNQRRRAHADVMPNAAHFALARLEREHGGNVTIVTQNIDALHEAAGSQNLIHMHGELLKALCAHCGERQACTGDLCVETLCGGKPGGMRPDVVWFGEMPYEMERIYALLTDADLFISIGTSGTFIPLRVSSPRPVPREHARWNSIWNRQKAPRFSTRCATDGRLSSSRPTSSAFSPKR